MKRSNVGHHGGGVLEAFIDVADLPIIADRPLVIQCTELIFLGGVNSTAKITFSVITAVRISTKFSVDKISV